MPRPLGLEQVRVVILDEQFDAGDHRPGIDSHDIDRQIARGCEGVKPGWARVNCNYFLTEEDEVRLGEAFYEPYVHRSGGLYPDYRIQAALKNFARPVLDTTRRRAFRWDIALMRNGQPNAWALPCGKISINRGLLTELRSEAELAAVLGHEIVHAAAKHGAKGMQRGMLLQGAVAIATIAVAT